MLTPVAFTSIRPIWFSGKQSENQSQNTPPTAEQIGEATARHFLSKLLMIPAALFLGFYGLVAVGGISANLSDLWSQNKQTRTLSDSIGSKLSDEVNLYQTGTFRVSDDGRIFQQTSAGQPDKTSLVQIGSFKTDGSVFNAKGQLIGQANADGKMYFLDVLSQTTPLVDYEQITLEGPLQTKAALAMAALYETQYLRELAMMSQTFIQKEVVGKLTTAGHKVYVTSDSQLYIERTVDVRPKDSAFSYQRKEWLPFATFNTQGEVFTMDGKKLAQVDERGIMTFMENIWTKDTVFYVDGKSQIRNQQKGSDQYGTVAMQDATLQTKGAIAAAGLLADTIELMDKTRQLDELLKK